jgi:dolichol-phosphate mannosyltransferase
MKKILSIISPCFNEEENLPEFYKQLVKVIDEIKNYDFEIIFIDNASVDKSVKIIEEFIRNDPRVKLIINARNFGPIRSPYWGLMQSSGVATIVIVSDLQEPPEYIPQLIGKWEMGWKVVLAKKPKSKSNFLMHQLRRLYYKILNKISDVDLVNDANGFGIYDQDVINLFRQINDPYPYVRGLVCELGFPVGSIEYNQSKRFSGKSKNNFYSLYDAAMLGFTSHSLVPIRLAGMLGFIVSFFSFLAALIYLVLKIIYWDKFARGISPLIIIILLLFGILFIFLGILGEYIALIHNKIRNRPIVVEKQRINF